MKKEYLFNILMEYEIPFLTNKEKTFFILMDEKIVISSKELSKEIEEILVAKKYKIFLRVNGFIEPSVISLITMDSSIFLKYDEIEV